MADEPSRRIASQFSRGLTKFSPWGVEKASGMHFPLCWLIFRALRYNAPDRPPPVLMSGLLEGWDRFDNAAEPGEGRKMRLSRQAIRHIANQLIDQQIMVAHDDPSNGRSMVLGITQRSTGIRAYAR